MKHDKELALAEEIFYDEEWDEDSFWFGSLFKKKENAEKEINDINEVLKGTGANAKLEFAVNYNEKGIPWGTVILNLTEEGRKKLGNKYNLTELK